MANIHPAGSFDATITEHGYSFSGTNTTQLMVRFETQHGSIVGYFSFSDAAVEYTIEKIRNMGFQGDDLDALNGDCLIGNKCSIVVDHEEYNGQMKAKVKFVNAFGQSREFKRDAAAAAKAKMFNGLLRKQAKITPPPQAAPKPSPAATQGEPEPDWGTEGEGYDERNPPPDDLGF